MSRLSPAAAAAFALTVAGCVAPSRPPIASPPPPQTSPALRPVPVKPVPALVTPASRAPTPAGVPDARAAGVRPGPAVAELPIDPARAADALAAFAASCPALTKRADASGLTQPADWQPACAAAAGWPRDDAAGFFARFFETALVGDGRFYATGYYEPEIAGTRDPAPGSVPIYAVPSDLVTVALGDFLPSLKGKEIRGRLEGSRLVPYYDRGQIEDGAIAGKAPVLAYATDPIAFFFLQIQGSGIVRLADGAELRLAYAGQNGQPYTGIGRWMIDQGLITRDQGSMQGIVAWLKAHPDQADHVMRQDRSFVFFRELTGPGPIGALGVPVSGRVTVAADPDFVPLGAPVWLSADRPEAAGLWVAQDTGGAIKGPNRFDTFWGAGDEAARIAGGMSARGLDYLLLPKGSLARLGDASARP